MIVKDIKQILREDSLKNLCQTV